MAPCPPQWFIKISVGGVDQNFGVGRLGGVGQKNSMDLNVLLFNHTL